MKLAPVPKNEVQRLTSLYSLGLLDTPPEERFDLITRTTNRIFHTPISTLTLVDAKREWFKSLQGLATREGDRAVSFCGHSLLAPDIFVVPDTKKDDRFADNPWVTGKPYVRFYAGVPVLSPDKERIGVLCIKDTRPRQFSKGDQGILKGLASWAELEIHSRNLSLALRDSLKKITGRRGQTKEFDRLSKLEKESKKALVRVMRDMEVILNEVEQDKAKDEAVITNISEGLIAIDDHGKVMIVSKVAEDLLGWKHNEMIGKKFTGLNLEDEERNFLPPDRRPISLAMTTGEIIRGTYFFVGKDKTRFPMALTTTPIRLKGEVVGFIVMIRDISKETEVINAKSEFVSLASHQLRTPLGLIKWYLEAMKHEACFGQAPMITRRYINEVYKNNERVLSLVRDLLSVSRIDQGRIKNQPKPVDVTVVVGDVVKQLQVLTRKKKVALRLVILSSKIPKIKIDILRLRETIENLIVNAIEYSKALKSVTVSVKRRGGAILISVRDAGIGITKEDQKKIFNKFFRSEKAVQFNPEGTGLGLYVVKSYVEGWGGKVSVASTEGKGSIFTISLPIKKRKRQKGGEVK